MHNFINEKWIWTDIYSFTLRYIKRLRGSIFALPTEMLQYGMQSRREYKRGSYGVTRVSNVHFFVTSVI